MRKVLSVIVLASVVLAAGIVSISHASKTRQIEARWRAKPVFVKDILAAH